jgi:hypothetical protein
VKEKEVSDIKFFVEKHPESLNEPRHEALKKLLNEEVCDFLESRKWGICLASIHLSEFTAKIIQDINKNYPRLPIVMWLTLPDRQGYWTNETNISETKSLTKNLENWINQYNLNIAGFGFDIEPPLNFVKETQKSKFRFALNVVKRNWLVHKSQKENFRQALDDLISDVRHQGIPTEAYVSPWPTAKLFNVAPTTSADYDFVMVYTSLFKDSLAPKIFQYLNKENPKQYPALGNFTHDMKQHDGRKLSPREENFIAGPKELERDLLYLAQKSQKDKRNYLERFRVFALTGKPILEVTKNALKKIKMVEGV